uniref:Uncharacterized protein n=1 Tax=Photinus pyralis TaxID=7054 RepID=A0A1Y1MM74_PHOPY
MCQVVLRMCETIKRKKFAQTELHILEIKKTQKWRIKKLEILNHLWMRVSSANTVPGKSNLNFGAGLFRVRWFKCLHYTLFYFLCPTTKNSKLISQQIMDMQIFYWLMSVFLAILQPSRTQNTLELKTTFILITRALVRGELH